MSQFYLTQALDNKYPICHNTHIDSENVMTTKDQIIELLNTRPLAIARALVALNVRQVRDEQLSEQTRYNNGVGFTPCGCPYGNLDG